MIDAVRLRADQQSLTVFDETHFNLFAEFGEKILLQGRQPLRCVLRILPTVAMLSMNPFGRLPKGNWYRGSLSLTLFGERVATGSSELAKDQCLFARLGQRD